MTISLKELAGLIYEIQKLYPQSYGYTVEYYDPNNQYTYLLFKNRDDSFDKKNAFIIIKYHM